MSIQIAIKLGKPKVNVKNLFEKASILICDTTDPQGVPEVLARGAAIVYKANVLTRMGTTNTTSASSMSAAAAEGSMTAQAQQILIPDNDPIVVYETKKLGKTSFSINIGHINFDDINPVLPPAIRREQGRGDFARFAQSIGLYQTTSAYDSYSMIAENVFHIREYGTRTRSKDPNSNITKTGKYPVGFRLRTSKGRLVGMKTVAELIAEAGQQYISDREQQQRRKVTPKGQVSKETRVLDLIQERNFEELKKILSSQEYKKLHSLLGGEEHRSVMDPLHIMSSARGVIGEDKPQVPGSTAFQWLLDQMEEDVTFDMIGDAPQWAHLKHRDGGSIFQWHPGVAPRNWFTDGSNKAYQDDINDVVIAIKDLFADPQLQSKYFRKIK